MNSNSNGNDLFFIAPTNQSNSLGTANEGYIPLYHSTVNIPDFINKLFLLKWGLKFIDNNILTVVVVGQSLITTS